MRFLALLLILTFPATTFAAFSVHNDFATSTVGDLTGQGGGSGWSLNWTGNTAYDVQTATVYNDTKAIQDSVTANANHTINRDLSSEVSGDLYIAWQQSSVSGACPYIILREGVTSRGIVRGPCTLVNNDMVIYNYTTPAYEVLQAGLSANTWYIIHVQFDMSTYQYRARLYTTSWQPYTGYKGMSAGNGVSRFEIQNEGEAATNGTLTFDAIQTTDPFPAAVSPDRPQVLINNGTIRLNNGSIIRR